MNYLITIIAFIASTAAFFLGKFGSENKKLKEDKKENDDLINKINKNAKIQNKNSKLSKSDLINGL